MATAREVADGLTDGILEEFAPMLALRMSEAFTSALTAYGKARYREGLEAGAKVAHEAARIRPVDSRGPYQCGGTDAAREIEAEIRALANAKEGE